jgi:hypothetical protein
VEAQPPTGSTDRDFEVSFGICAAFTVRVVATGEVRWTGASFVKSTGQANGAVSAERARALIERFRAPRYWALCRLYSRNVTDSAAMQVDIQIGGRMKTVADHAGAAPEWLDELEYAVDEAADNHQWRHGDPRPNRSLMLEKMVLCRRKA